SIAVRTREFRKRAIAAPALRQETIVLQWLIEPHETRSDLSFSVSHDLFIDLRLRFVGNHLIMGLKDLLARDRIEEEFRRQNFFAGAFHDRADTVRPAGRPNHSTYLVQRFE